MATGTQSNGMATTSPQTLTQGQNFTDPAGRTGIVNFDTKTGAKLATGATTPTPFNPNNQSTTTLSSGNAASKVPGITAKTTNLADTGVRTQMDAGGNPISTLANGQAYNPPTPPEPSKTGTNQTGDSMYVGDTPVAPGEPIPTDINGNPMVTTQYPKSVQTNIDSFNSLIAKNDANTATLLQNIQNQYKDLITQQDKANASATGAANSYAVTGGQGVASAGNVISGAITAGLDAISNLVDKESMAITNAQIAGDNQDFQLQDKINTEIEKVRQEKQDAAIQLSKDIQTAKKDAQDKIDKQNSADGQLAQGWAKTAMDSNQPQLAAQISSLDPASPTFKEDLATLQAQIQPNNSLDSQYKQMQIKEIAQKISDAKVAAKSATNGGMTGLSGLVSPVTQLPDGTYDTATQNALLAQMSPADAALVKAVGNYTMDIAKVTSLRSDQRQLLAEKVALVYPNFDMTNYATHAAYRKSLAGTTQGTTGGAINSANKVINHLTSYINNVNNLSNTAIGGGIGEFINSTKSNLLKIVNPSLQKQKAEAQIDAVGVKDELAKFFKGSGVADVHTIDDWAKAVNVDASPAAQQGAVQGAIELLQGQLVPMIDQYKQVMGQEPPPGLFLKTDTAQKLSSLKNQGFKIDIPGVNYTDKNAWLKYGGGSQDQWNTAIDNLTKAGLPITEENILQASQL